MKKSDISVLIVDDDESVRKVFFEAVKRMGFKPLIAGKPDEALHLLKFKSIEAAIIDIMLPKMNGVELAAELRKTLPDIPIIFMSGIFKDKAFAQDATKRTKALQFFYKPLNIDDVLNLLEENLDTLVEAPKVALHSLLTKPFVSQRDRRKALDHIEEICGYDLPLIFCIFMESASSGHLNLVNNAGDIFGMTIVNGKILNVDTEGSAVALGSLLMQQGYITEKDLEELGVQRTRGDIVKNLINENLVSPHVGPKIKVRHIMNEIRNLVSGDIMRINFVPDRNLVEDASFVDMDMFMPVLHDLIENQVSVEWLEKFYKEWNEHAVRMGPNFNKIPNLLALPILSRLPNLAKHLKDEKTIRQISDLYQGQRFETLKAIHFLAIRRYIVFEEEKRVSNSDDLEMRFQEILKNINGKNPIEVFAYFGAAPQGSDPRPEAVERIYKEYIKANHPDRLPPNTSVELKALSNKVFAIMSEAHGVLTNEERRAKLKKDIKNIEMQSQLQAEEIMNLAVNDLKRGLATQSLKALEKAYALHKTNVTLLYLIWAKLKANQGINVDEIKLQLETVPVEERRNALYLFVDGLHKSACGDKTGAASSYQRALGYDPEYLEARREISALRSAQGNSSKSILDADLGELVSNIFKKK